MLLPGPTPSLHAVPLHHPHPGRLPEGLVAHHIPLDTVTRCSLVQGGTVDPLRGVEKLLLGFLERGLGLSQWYLKPERHKDWRCCSPLLPWGQVRASNQAKDEGPGQALARSHFRAVSGGVEGGCMPLGISIPS